jgi:hypothetical protein
MLKALYDLVGGRGLWNPFWRIYKIIVMSGDCRQWVWYCRRYVVRRSARDKTDGVRLSFVEVVRDFFAVFLYRRTVATTSGCQTAGTAPLTFARWVS